MASSRKKQDEKNLKMLRELASLPQNKYCFDCNQRGPTYVNVTIGSFVCTKCSGMLRGLTPPHRVKSISMATFTNEEVDLLRKRGNEYCQKVWLGLHEGGPQAPGAASDETSIRDFMVEKYERRRYYLEPSRAVVEPPAAAPKPDGVLARPAAGRPRPEAGRNGHHHNHHHANGTATINNISGNSNPQTFVPDFSEANMFNGCGGRTPPTNGNSFANSENNPVFGNCTAGTTTTTSTGIPPTTFPTMNGWNYSNQSVATTTTTVTTNNTSNNNYNASNSFQNGVAAPSQSVVDKYAALKDLDNEIKSQKSNLEWSSTSSNGSLYSSPTPPVSSPSPQSLFGSPSQGQFQLGTFPLSNQENTISNPFNNGGSFNWGPVNGQQQMFSNPFRDATKLNGFSQGFQPTLFPVSSSPMFVNGTNGWAPNPFKVGTMNSNNPFL